MRFKGKYIPLISGFLIFIGYVYNHGFYSQFGIDISSFFTTGELILSFLPFIFPIIITTVILITFFLANLPIQAKRAREAKEAEEKGVESEHTEFRVPFRILGEFLRHGLNKNEKALPQIGKLFFNALIVLAFFYYAYELVYPFIHDYIRKSGTSYYSPEGYFIACIIVYIIIRWLLFFIVKEAFYNLYKISPENIEGDVKGDVKVNAENELNNDANTKIKRDNRTNQKLKIKQPLINIFTFLFLIGSVWVFKSYKAFLILENKPLYEVYIETNERVYQSSKNIAFIGHTKDYYFLRDIDGDLNIILNHKDIQLVKLREIDKGTYLNKKVEADKETKASVFFLKLKNNIKDIFKQKK